ncbi:SDR family oxidoreductase [Mycolicibacterium sp. 018/SC-01/001]|uniref:SDR family NAD(P)-dependent oxidoreductase n=1 Tax=Mycolicibacterium sp. 018/SC-01/001 TaxID=2592069 RepID=UPI00117E7137|nr:SDR family NAD(P)-dependent oxidoreductase [Mycolicibacterium sp. 018/SC-01/001]TRW76971.1 SDR family oxidoreductase [Mycolicibacterium sp. 018/SC-01/001]
MNSNIFEHSARRGVVVITHADTDSGRALALKLLADGRQVAVTASTPASLSRILLGQSADQIMAIGADIDDPAQRAAVLKRVQDRLGPIAEVIDGRRYPPIAGDLPVAS